MYKLLLILMLSQNIVAYAMNSDVVGLPKEQHNKIFRKRLEKIQSCSQILMEDYKNGNETLAQFTREEYAQIGFWFDRRKTVLRLHRQDKSGLLIYYKRLTPSVLDEICGEGKKWSDFKKENKINKTIYENYLRTIGKLAILVSDVEQHAPEVNRTHDMVEKFKSYDAALKEIFPQI